MFSKACEYGIKAVIFIATESIGNKRVKINDIAENTGSPEYFTAKILSELTKKDIVSSIKGPYGGFSISISKMKEIKISDIVSAIDGDSVYKGCALGLSECNEEKPCPMHYKFAKVRNNLKEMLETTSVFELATQYITGEAILMR